jgi:hypothetical protein
MKLAILIPCFNEPRTVAEILSPVEATTREILKKRTPVIRERLVFSVDLVSPSK